MTNNKRFALGLALGGGLAVCAWLAMLVGQLGRPHLDNVWVEQAYQKKIQAAMASEAPRVLIVAGSGAMFGVDSGVLSEAWGMPVTNLGVNAGIGPQAIISYALPLIGEGDVVIAPLEYPLYLYHGETNYVQLSYLLSHPDMLFGLPRLSLLETLWVTPLKRVVEGYQPVPQRYEVAGLYGPHNLDGNGDQIHSELALRDSRMHRLAVEQKAEVYGKDFTHTAMGWDMWHDFSRALRGRGACIIFVPPPMMSRPEYFATTIEQSLYRDLPAVARRQGLNYRGDPRDFLYPPDWFFDTNYHLVAEKRLVYTRALLGLLGDEPDGFCGPDQAGNS